tara:strand:+ start:423 stop:620 length:198 start_codon:yes stop_codon:yes gene_type:complete
MISRFSHLFRARDKINKISRGEKILFDKQKAVDTNGNGTSGYVVKEGANKGKILAHNSTKSTNNW